MPTIDHVLAREQVVVDIAVGVQLLAGERVVARERRLGPARVPMVAVGHQQRIEALHRAAPERELPAPALQATRVDDLGLEPDVVAEAEVVDVVVEVLGDMGVVREVRIGLRHREVRVLHPVARGVDEQLPIGGRHAVPVAEDPVAADAVGGLEAGERDAALVERLGGGDPGRAGADDGGLGKGGHRGPPYPKDDAGVNFVRLRPELHDLVDAGPLVRVLHRDQRDRREGDLLLGLRRPPRVGSGPCREASRLPAASSAAHRSCAQVEACPRRSSAGGRRP